MLKRVVNFYTDKHTDNYYTSYYPMNSIDGMFSVMAPSVFQPIVADVEIHASSSDLEASSLFGVCNHAY